MLALLAANGVDAPLSVLVESVLLNAHVLLTLGIVFLVVLTNRSIGPMRELDARVADVPEADGNEAQEGSLLALVLPMLILVGGSIGFMAWTGNGNILLAPARVRSSGRFALRRQWLSSSSGCGASRRRN